MGFGSRMRLHFDLLDGSAAVEVSIPYRRRKDRLFGWSADGRRILIISSRASTDWRIESVGPGGDEKLVATLGEVFEADEVILSPDRRSVVYFRTDAGGDWVTQVLNNHPPQRLKGPSPTSRRSWAGCRRPRGRAELRRRSDRRPGRGAPAPAPDEIQQRAGGRERQCRSDQHAPASIPSIHQVTIVPILGAAGVKLHGPPPSRSNE